MNNEKIRLKFAIFHDAPELYRVGASKERMAFSTSLLSRLQDK